MINVLIVDDEKIEREGLKYLISTEMQITLKRNASSATAERLFHF